MHFLRRILLIFCLYLTGCAYLSLPPEMAKVSYDRLATFPQQGLPLTAPVQIAFNEYNVPFLEAKTDADLAFALGVTHAYFRLGQMELMRRVASGRLSEVMGTIATDIDKSLRILDFGFAAKDIWQGLPPESRQWAERYLAGLNWYIENTAEPSWEYKLFAIPKEKWTPEDLVRVWRLASSDVTWFTYFAFLQKKRTPDLERLWAYMLGQTGRSTPSFAAPDKVSQMLLPFFESGSNSLAISAKRAQQPSSLIASDPHLGMNLPNPWFLVGYKSPSYHVVGLTLPGLPFVAIGRNPEVAWGGTNLRGVSSFLYELSPEQVAAASVEKQEISVRSWLDDSVEVRRTPWGPVLSDAPVFAKSKPFALSWAGHRVSDELTAFLKANRARNWQEFRTSFASYSVAGMNILYADRKGNVGHLLAFQQPEKKMKEHPLFNSTLNPVVAYRSSLELPSIYNPESGYVASANNVPTPALTSNSYLYASNNRIARLQSLLAAKTGSITTEDLQRWQKDTVSLASRKLAELIVATLQGRSRLSKEEKYVLPLLEKWDGTYSHELRSPVALELILHNLNALVLKDKNEIFEKKDLLNLYSRAMDTKEEIWEHMTKQSAQVRERWVRRAVEQAYEPLLRIPNWGEFNQYEMGYPLKSLPVIGSRYTYVQFPADGGSDTLYKAARVSGMEPGTVSYGSNARHVTDMADINANYFVLLGGQDGDVQSPALIDQVPLWREGRYVQMPLDLDQVHKLFTRQLTLQPKP